VRALFKKRFEVMSIKMTEKTLQKYKKPTNKLKARAAMLFKSALYFMGFVTLSVMLSKLATVHGKDISEDYFSNGYPTILGLLDSELFMGIIFMVTLAILIYVVKLLWGLHEVAVHKAQAIASQQIQLVFALSLCGLFIHKAWWVVAIIIAFTRWDLIGERLTSIISNSRTGERK
jgi:hypothetical protein